MTTIAPPPHVPAHAAAAPDPARIGPNAITQTIAALDATLGAAVTMQVLAAAGLGRYRETPPAAMVPEEEVRRLFAAARERLGERTAAQLLREAGSRTGDYLMRHRIPRPAQRLLAVLPGALAARILLSAVERHAWTFVGTGVFTWAPHPRGVSVRIDRCPICRDAHTKAPACSFYAGTFERLFTKLVDARSVAVEVTCTGRGDARCRVEVRW